LRSPYRAFLTCHAMTVKKRARKGLLHKSFSLKGTYCGVEEYELIKNGLRVLYAYDSGAPVVGLMVTYMVGSRYEATGYTGSTHILEHLMFKGSKHFPSKKGISALDLLSQKGALVNATTWYDRTNYYEVLPDEHFEYAVRLEADRMRNALITKKDLAEELPAVKSEFAAGAESDPVEFLEERMWATAFIAHPYHHAVIGWESDVDNTSVEKLQQFYNTYYHPNNAIVTVTGNVDREHALTLIATHFGIHPRSKQAIPKPHTKEPPQLGRRFFEVQRFGTKNIVCVAFKVPEALHKDTSALVVLSSLLATGKTSRMYRALVEKKIASSVWKSFSPLHDPSLLLFFATPLEGVSHEKVEKALLDTCYTMLEHLVTDAELARVVSMVATEIAFARDGQYEMLSSLNESLAVGDWCFFFDLPKKIATVTPLTVQEVAKKYFKKDSLTVGYYKAEEE